MSSGEERPTGYGGTRSAGPLVGAVCAMVLVMMAAPISSRAASAPAIGSPRALIAGNEATLEAEIRPEGLETTYELLLEGPACEAREPACEAIVSRRVSGGSISRERLEEDVSVPLTGLAWDRSYTYWIFASNSLGSRAASLIFETGSPPPAGGGEGTGAGQPYEQPEEPWVMEGAKRAAEESVKLEAERQAKKRAEEEAARQSAATPSASPEPACLVPALKGDSARSARAALLKAHCTLGHVVVPPGKVRGSVVVRQNHPPGTQLPAGTAIVVHLGVRRPTSRQ